MSCVCVCVCVYQRTFQEAVSMPVLVYVSVSPARPYLENCERNFIVYEMMMMVMMMMMMMMMLP